MGRPGDPAIARRTASSALSRHSATSGKVPFNLRNISKSAFWGLDNAPRTQYAQNPGIAAITLEATAVTQAWQTSKATFIHCASNVYAAVRLQNALTDAGRRACANVPAFASDTPIMKPGARRARYHSTRL